MSKYKIDEKSRKFKFELGVATRLVLNTIFPEKASLLDRIFINDIKKQINFTPEEIDKIKLTLNKDGNFTWSTKEATLLSLSITKAQLEFMKEFVEKLDKEEAVLEHLETFFIQILEA